MSESTDLARLYAERFAAEDVARSAMWDALCEGYFQRWVDPGAVVALGEVRRVLGLDAKSSRAICHHATSRVKAGWSHSVRRTDNWMTTEWRLDVSSRLAVLRLSCRRRKGDRHRTKLS